MIDFPASPSEGQVFQAPGGPQYVYSNGGWRMSSPLFATITQTVLLTSGSYNKPVGLRYLDVEIMSPGGGGGGAGATPAAQYACGAGGGAGGWGRQLFAAASLPASVAYTVGAVGQGVLSGAGTAGGTTTFLTLSATGGGGAAVGVNSTGATMTAPSGGVVTGGQLAVQGGRGGNAYWVAASGVLFAGEGANSPFGMGGSPGTNGGAGTGYGAGGGGALNIANQATGKTGGDGAPGFILLKEYF